ncbi:MAG TPA: hypothetical protein VM100_11045 [Longimicrobiales bacterium]|nr:hypothetical protein [Longimicrobiales bacterium]
MKVRSILFSVLALCVVSIPARAQNITEETVTAFLRGVEAQKPELDKVAAEITVLETKITEFKKCSEILRETMSGLKLKVALKAKCGATSEDGFYKDRQKLLDQPEKVGAAAAGMKAEVFSHMKEKVGAYLNGDRNFAPNELKALNAHATALANAMGMALAKASTEDRGGGGGGIGGRIGNAIAGKMRMFTPDMTWAYVGYLWSIMYMSGATMFETAYTPGQWTQWQIVDASQPDSKTVIERAFLSRDKDGSEWWRIKSISSSPEATDTIILESLFKKLDASGLAMQVVRMRGKLPGDTEGKELMVPQSLSMLSMNAMFPFKPTAESIAGATVGTESVKVGSSSYSAKRVKFGAGGGNMEWWLAEKAPGSVVRVQFTGNDKDQKWTMEMTGAGNGAKSELGVK